jgi:hypothetical protein
MATIQKIPETRGVRTAGKLKFSRVAGSSRVRLVRPAWALPGPFNDARDKTPDVLVPSRLNTARTPDGQAVRARHPVYVGKQLHTTRARTRTVTDFLDEKRNEITDRLKVLKPAVDEFKRLEAAASALASVGGSNSTATATATTATPRRRGPGRRRGSSIRTSTGAASTAAPAKATREKVGRPAGRRAGRRKGNGQRGAEALSIIQGQPGITIPELAAKIGIKQNYFYRLLPPLEQAGRIFRQGRGWHPKDA